MTFAFRFFGIGAIAAALAGCGVFWGQQPVLQKGDATSAEILYSGDIANAVPLARQHCAGYGRVPRLTDTTPGIAYFACDRP
jgi:hypothetical protein